MTPDLTIRHRNQQWAIHIKPTIRSMRVHPSWKQWGRPWKNR